MELLFIVILVFILYIWNHHQTTCTDSTCDPNYNYKKYKIKETANYTNVSALEDTDYNTLKYRDYDHYKHLIFG